MEYKTNSFPFEIVDVEPQLTKHLLQQFTGECTGFVRVGPKGYFLPEMYRQEANYIYNIPLRCDDVFVITYPRSGTTFTQELVWMVVKDLDYATSNKVLLNKRYPFLERHVLYHPTLQKKLKSEHSESVEKLTVLANLYHSVYDQLAETNSQRFIKTHLPISLLPPKMIDTAKIVYVARDPRDMIVSFYHISRIHKAFDYVGDFKTLWNFFMRDLLIWTPYFEHLKEAWEMRHHPNMLFLFYEELITDLPAVVRRVAAFFNKEFTNEQIEGLCNHLSFENFKKNESVNFSELMVVFNSTKFEEQQPHIRQGKTGGWREYFDDEMTREAENWMAENLKGSDFQFSHLKS